MITICICDDNEKAVEKLRDKLLQVSGEKLQIISFSNAISLQTYLMKMPNPCINMIFMNVCLNETDEIEIAKCIQVRHPEIAMIFMADHEKYAQDIFRADPTYFLIKPIEDSKLILAYQKALGKARKRNETMIRVDTGGAIHNIPFREICYAESRGRMLYIHKKEETLQTYMKLNRFEELSPCYFLRCHQSYTVNMEAIKSLAREEIILLDNKKIPISRARYKKAKELFKNEISSPILSKC